MIYGMSAITLQRTDPTKNMLRFYRLDVQPVAKLALNVV